MICAWGRLGHCFGCRALRLPAGHHHHGEGADLGLRPDGGDDRLRRGLRAVHARAPRCSPTASRSPATRSPRRPRWRNLDDLRARGPLRARPAQGGRVPRPARGPARHPDRRRRPRRRVLPRDRAGQGQGDQGGLHRRGVRAAAARLPLRRALPPGPDLPRRRSRRPRDPARAAADLRHRAVRGDRADPALGARRRHGRRSRPLLTVKSSHRRARAGARSPATARPTGRSAGSTSPSWRTRPVAHRAASCC